MIIRRDSCHGGFATLIAIFLLAMVSLALAVLAARFTAEARRTRQTPADAQLRQLLLAGVEAARAQLAANAADASRVSSGPVTIPQQLAGAELSLQWVLNGQSTDVLITAVIDGRQADQQVAWRWEGSRWVVQSAKLVLNR